MPSRLARGDQIRKEPSDANVRNQGGNYDKIHNQGHPEMDFPVTYFGYDSNSKDYASENQNQSGFGCSRIPGAMLGYCFGE
jgi:hypothetical protein